MRCSPVRGAAGGWGTSSWPGGTTIAPRRGHGAVARARGAGGPSLRASALTPSLVLAVSVPWAKKAGGRVQGGQGASQEG